MPEEVDSGTVCTTDDDDEVDEIHGEGDFGDRCEYPMSNEIFGRVIFASKDGGKTAHEDS